MGEDLFPSDSSYNGGDILERVDEYSLYCHYLGVTPELGECILSPLRYEHHPSFQIFESAKSPDREFMWKDHGSNQTGDIFTLVQYMYGYASKREAVLHVGAEFGKGDPGAVLSERKVLLTLPKPARNSTIEIRIKARSWLKGDLDYWNPQGISLATLTHYRVSPIEFLWMVAGQQSPQSAERNSYAYRVNSGGKILYKVYRPYSTLHKFRNNFTDEVIEGFEQLRPSAPVLILTKSTKESMWIRENMGLDAVAGRSETSYLKEGQVRHLQSRFGRIISFMDPDRAGHQAALHYQRYDITSIMLAENGPKDITDYTKALGLKAAISELTKLLGDHG